MNDAIRRHRVRRAMRLKSRLDSDNKKIDWITTETGSHIPLQNGKAVGGPLEGKSFENANTSESGNVSGKRRKQKDNGSGRLKQGEVDEFNRKALDMIMEETGMSREDAGRFQNNLLEYFNGDYANYTNGSKKEEVKNIDECLAKMEPYDGEIYRGLRFEPGQDALFSEFENIAVGDEFSMKSVSSWSSSGDVGKRYSGFGKENANGVMITCKSNKTGVGMQHVSPWRDEEAEVLAPSTGKWKVTGKKVITQYDALQEKFSKMKPTGPKDYYAWNSMRILLSDKEKELKSHKLVMLEVEEI